MIFPHGAVNVALTPCALPSFNKERALTRIAVREGASGANGLGKKQEYYGYNEQGKGNAAKETKIKVLAVKGFKDSGIEESFHFGSEAKEEKTSSPLAKNLGNGHIKKETEDKLLGVKGLKKFSGEKDFCNGHVKKETEVKLLSVKGSKNNGVKESLGKRSVEKETEVKQGKQRVNVMGHHIVVLLLVSTLVFGTEVEGTNSPTSSPSTSTPKPVITPIEKCSLALNNSRFKLLNTEDYTQWMDNETTFELAETGTWTGPIDIAEYVRFMTNPNIFLKFDNANDTSYPLNASEDGSCQVMRAYISSATTKPNKLNPQGVCFEWVTGLTLHYTINPTFLLKKLNLFFPIAFLEAFFDSFDADDVRDSVCNIMESNCTETLQFNKNLTVDGCKDAYDKLNMTDNGYLDSNTKGCRILHSTFVPINTGHCPHLSFAELVDEKGMIKCQKSKGRKPSDLFSPQELENIRTKGQDLGFPTSLSRSCTTNAPTKVPTKVPTKAPTKVPTKITLSGKGTKNPVAKASKKETVIFN